MYIWLNTEITFEKSLTKILTSDYISVSDGHRLVSSVCKKDGVEGMDASQLSNRRFEALKMITTIFSKNGENNELLEKFKNLITNAMPNPKFPFSSPKEYKLLLALASCRTNSKLFDYLLSFNDKHDVEVLRCMLKSIGASPSLYRNRQIGELNQQDSNSRGNAFYLVIYYGGATMIKQALKYYPEFDVNVPCLGGLSPIKYLSFSPRWG